VLVSWIDGAASHSCCLVSQDAVSASSSRQPSWLRLRLQFPQTRTEPACKWESPHCKSPVRDLVLDLALTMNFTSSYLFLAIYSLGVDVAGVVFYGELFPNHLRAKGLALSIATIALTDLVYLQATATAFANIGWKFYLVSCLVSSSKKSMIERPLILDRPTGLHHHLRPRCIVDVLRPPRDQGHPPRGDCSHLWRRR
jgi:hypothetical protein